MHRALKAETSCPAAANARAQQRRFDHFRLDYNRERPHEALDQQPPATHYDKSPRPYPARIPEPWYDADHAVRWVRTSGEIKGGGELVFISESLIGEPVGIAETDQGDWIVRFATIDLGIIDRTTKRLRRFAAARPGRVRLLRLEGRSGVGPQRQSFCRHRLLEVVPQRVFAFVRSKRAKPGNRSIQRRLLRSAGLHCVLERL